MVLAWVSERLAVAMRQAEDEDNVLDKPTLIDLEARWGNKAEGASHRERLSETGRKVCDSLNTANT
jgi:hypothetical protein